MKLSVVVLAVAGALAAGGAVAQPDVVKSKGCLNCHDVDKKKVGPAFKEVAAKRKGQEAALVAKLKDGKGHMKINASEAEIKAAVQWVLSQK